MNKITVCFSGHRLLPPDELPALRKELEAAVLALAEGGSRDFWAGGAPGFDTLAARVVLWAKHRRPRVRLCLALPYPGQEDSFKGRDKAVYRQILRQASRVVFTSDHYFRGCMHKRNRYLVDASDLCVCYLAAEKGGTWNTVEYCRKKGKPFENLANKK